MQQQSMLRKAVKAIRCRGDTNNTIWELLLDNDTRKGKTTHGSKKKDVTKNGSDTARADVWGGWRARRLGQLHSARNPRNGGDQPQSGCIGLGAGATETQMEMGRAYRSHR